MASNIGYMFGNPPDSRSKEADDLLVDSDTFLGIELELEEISHLRYFQRFLTDNNWRWITDHSLRGSSCELITSSPEGLPIRGMDLVTALEALDLAVKKAYATYGTYPDVSVRCSTHIHCDVRDLSPDQISRFILYYLMFEEILLKSESPERCDNNYCLPVSKSADLKRSLVNVMTREYAESSIQDMVATWPKYSALNVGAASKFGTVEFRIFPGSYNPEKILMWVNIILSLRRAAVRNTLEIGTIPQMISGTGLDKLLAQIFPTNIVEYLLPSIQPRDMLRGARLIQSMQSRRFSQYPKRPHLTGKAVVDPKDLSNNFKAFMAMQESK
jgi:hypothetical protein